MKIFRKIVKFHEILSKNHEISSKIMKKFRKIVKFYWKIMKFHQKITKNREISSKNDEKWSDLDWKFQLRFSRYTEYLSKNVKHFSKKIREKVCLLLCDLWVALLKKQFYFFDSGTHVFSVLHLSLWKNDAKNDAKFFRWLAAAAGWVACVINS